LEIAKLKEINPTDLKQNSVLFYAVQPQLAMHPIYSIDKRVK